MVEDLSQRKGENSGGLLDWSLTIVLPAMQTAEIQQVYVLLFFHCISVTGWAFPVEFLLAIRSLVLYSPHSGMLKCIPVFRMIRTSVPAQMPSRQSLPPPKSFLVSSCKKSSGPSWWLVAWPWGGWRTVGWESYLCCTSEFVSGCLHDSSFVQRSCGCPGEGVGRDFFWCKQGVSVE